MESKYIKKAIIVILLLSVSCAHADYDNDNNDDNNNKGIKSEVKKGLIRAGLGAAIFVALGLLDDVERDSRQQQVVAVPPGLDHDETQRDDSRYQEARTPLTGSIHHQKPKPSKGNKVTFNDVVGLKDQLVEVKEVVEFLKNPEKFNRLGAKIPKGILLEGPPGTGKTLIAKAIANEVGCQFFYESASSFVEMYVGMGAKRVRELFDMARRHKPAIIFIDELDAIGAVSRGFGGNEEYRQTLNELLCQLDGFESDSSIIVIAATNNANTLDKALKRPGRFTRIIKIPKPNKEAIKEILEHYLKKLPKVQNDLNIDDLVKKTDGFSAAELENLVNEAVMLAVRENADCVTKDHLDKAFDKLKNRG